jgi:hypothetical protein
MIEKGKKELVVGADIVTPIWLSHFVVKLVLIAAKIGKVSSVFKSNIKTNCYKALLKDLKSGEGELIAKKTTDFSIKYDKIKM